MMKVPPMLEGQNGEERLPNYLSSTVRGREPETKEKPERGRRGKSRRYELNPENKVYAFRFGEARGEPLQAWIKDLATLLGTTSGEVALALLENAWKRIEAGEAFLQYEDGKLTLIGS